MPSWNRIDQPRDPEDRPPDREIEPRPIPGEAEPPPERQQTQPSGPPGVERPNPDWWAPPRERPEPEEEEDED